jgi:hypothetical protein
MKFRFNVLIVSFSMLAACGGQKLSREREARAAPPASNNAPPITAERLDDLTALAIGTALEPGRRTAILQQLASGSLTIENYVKDLLQRPAFSREMVPHVVLGVANSPPGNYKLAPLSTKQIEGVPVYYSKTPCTLADTVDVHPWWDLSTTVKVCSANYQPKALKTRGGVVCTGVKASPSAECGCGPNLISCTKDEAHFSEVADSLYRETADTISYIVDHDLPFKEVFTTKYSFRDRNVEYIYARDRIYRDQIYPGAISQVPDLTSWPKDGQWAPRNEIWPGEHSGILTNRQMAWMSDGPRDRMRLFYSRGWCVEPSSFGVDVDVFRKTLRGVKDMRFKAEGWQRLAAQPGCTTCHARMDYGMQTFTGYPGGSESLTVTPEKSQHKKMGLIYGKDINDPRGEIPLTPQGFGEFLVAQEEFRDCMVQRVERHVLGTATSSERAELSKQFQKTGTIRSLFEKALLQYAKQASPVPAAAPKFNEQITPHLEPIIGDRVPVSDRLIALATEHCQHCHMDESEPLGFLADLEENKVLKRHDLIWMANTVAPAMMPKDAEMPEHERRELLLEIVRALSPDPTWAANATAYWLGDGFQPSRSHFIGALRNRVSMAAVGTPPPQREPAFVVDDAFEESLLKLTPGVLIQMGQLAITACKGKKQQERDDCLLRATRPGVGLVD